MTIFLESFSWPPSPPAWCFPGSWAWFISFSLGRPWLTFLCSAVEEADFDFSSWLLWLLCRKLFLFLLFHENLSCCFGLKAPSWNVACEACTSLGLSRTLASSYSPFFFFVASKNERLFSFSPSSVVCPEYIFSYISYDPFQLDQFYL